MPVEIKIWHEDAAQTLAELQVLAGGLAGQRHAGPQTSGHVGAALGVNAEGTPTDATPPAASATTAEPGASTTEEPAKRKRRTKAEIEAAARAAEGPAQQGAPTDSPEDEAQDEADEKAESEAEKTELTRDDVRAVLGKYVQKFGMDAAQEDGPKVIALMFGEGKGKVSDIPENQDDLAKAVAGVEEMLTKNPYQRVEVA